MADAREMTAALADHVAAIDDWDDKAERLVTESARAMLAAGITRVTATRELVSLGIDKQYARRVVSETATELQLPSEPGWLSRAFRRALSRVGRSRLVASSRATIRRHPLATRITVIVTALVAIAWTVYACTVYRMTPEEYEFLEEVKTQCAAGGNPNGPTDQPWLIEAAGKDYRAVVKFLIANGADTNIATSNGWTPLHAADDPAICKLLLKHGADPRRRTGGGRTPLHVAGDASVAKLLVRHGADINASDDEGRTPLDDCQFLSELDVALLLIRHRGRFGSGQGASLVNALAGQDQNHHALAALLEAGASANTREMGFYPLHRAVMGDSARNVTLLLKHGANLDATCSLDTYAGNWLDVARVQSKTNFSMSPETIPHHELVTTYNLTPVGGMTSLEVAGAIGANAAATALRTYRSWP